MLKIFAIFLALSLILPVCGLLLWGRVGALIGAFTALVILVLLLIGG